MIILKAKNFAINCNKVLKITQNDHHIEPKYKFNWLSSPWLQYSIVEKEKVVYQVNVEYVDALGARSVYRMSYEDREDQKDNFEVLMKAWARQDPEVNYLDKAVEDALDL